MECSATLAGFANGCVYQLYGRIVLFDDVGSIGRASARNVGAGVRQSTKATRRGGLLAISVCDFTVVQLPPQEGEKLVGLVGGGCPSLGDLGGRGMESGPFRVGLEDEASV